MAKEELQLFIWKICTDYGLDDNVILNENIIDVPKEYLELHMLINALKNIKELYLNKNKDFLEAYKFFSHKHRVWEISEKEFQSKYETFNASENSSVNNLILTNNN